MEGVVFQNVGVSASLKGVGGVVYPLPNTSLDFVTLIGSFPSILRHLKIETVTSFLNVYSKSLYQSSSLVNLNQKLYTVYI